MNNADNIRARYREAAANFPYPNDTKDDDKAAAYSFIKYEAWDLILSACQLIEDMDLHRQIAVDSNKVLRAALEVKDES